MAYWLIYAPFHPWHHRLQPAIRIMAPFVLPTRVGTLLSNAACLKRFMCRPSAAPCRRVMTEDMAVPLTAAWACRLLYNKQDLAGLQEFHLHLVGAAQFEFAHVSATRHGLLGPPLFVCVSPLGAKGPPLQGRQRYSSHVRQAGCSYKQL
jgi:hypothetical protein